MRCPNCGHDTDENPRSMCQNCGKHRREHYTPSGAWNGDFIGCSEYLGREPTEAERKKLEREAAKG